MRNCIVVGRVIPERAIARFGPAKFRFKYSDVTGSAAVFADYSQISVHLNFDDDYDNLYNIIAIAKSVTSPIVNYIAFMITAGYQITFDLVVDIDQQKHVAVGVSEPIFSENPDPFYTFRKQNDHADIRIPRTAIENFAAVRALEELSNALHRPHLSPMYCRLAIETIREYFDPEKEALGWSRLREKLNVRRETIDTFWKLAADQRHGRTAGLDWEQRKSCLRIAWEITNRFVVLQEDLSAKFEGL